MKDLEKHLEKHLKRMEQASREYCAVIQPAGRDNLVKELWTKITNRGKLPRRV